MAEVEEQSSLELWRASRWIVFNMMRLSPYLKDKPRRVEDVVRLPGDYVAKPKFTIDVSDKEIEALKKLKLWDF